MAILQINKKYFIEIELDNAQNITVQNRFKLKSLPVREVIKSRGECLRGAAKRIRYKNGLT